MRAFGSDCCKAWIVWDRYTTNYDVYARSYTPGGSLSPEMPIATTPRFEAHSSIAVDARNRPWVAFEVGGMNWGKDLGAALGPKAPGTPLGGTRHVEVACFDGQSWKAPADFAPHDSLALEQHRRLHAAPALRHQRQSLDGVQAPLQPELADSGFRRRQLPPQHLLGNLSHPPRWQPLDRSDPAPEQLGPQQYAHGPLLREWPALGLLAFRQPQLCVRQPSARRPRVRRISDAALGRCRAGSSARISPLSRLRLPPTRPKRATSPACAAIASRLAA